MRKDSKLATKADLKALEATLRKEIQEVRSDVAAFKDELKHEFRVVSEKLRDDVLGAIGDTHARVKEHAWRIERIERHVGLA